MRLIDADALKEAIQKELPAMSNWGEHFIPMLIDNAPTVDKSSNVEGDLISREALKSELLNRIAMPDWCSAAVLHIIDTLPGGQP